MNAPETIAFELDASDPVAWWKLFVDAVIAYRRGDYEPGNLYIRFVRANRSAAIAKKTAENIVQCAEAPKWNDCEKWPAWGYRTKDPTPRQDRYPKAKRKKR